MKDFKLCPACNALTVFDLPWTSFPILCRQCLIALVGVRRYPTSPMNVANTNLLGWCASRWVSERRPCHGGIHFDRARSERCEGVPLYWTLFRLGRSSEGKRAGVLLDFAFALNRRVEPPKTQVRVLIRFTADLARIAVDQTKAARCIVFCRTL